MWNGRASLSIIAQFCCGVSTQMAVISALRCSNSVYFLA
jgi:hypothetical protein